VRHKTSHAAREPHHDRTNPELFEHPVPELRIKAI
jgi:hypothetical protein